MFPKSLWNTIFNTDKYPELVKQKEEQASQYLKKIGREAKVSDGHVEKQLIKINVEASNKLLSEMTKYDAELNRFPYWIGTKELLLNGTRYIYETSQGKTEDGYDLITFKKTKADGTFVSEYQYKIIGSQPQLLQKK
jgi:bla regulator protein BlaR1